MQGVLRVALRPAMRSWGRSILRRLRDVPRPNDDPRVHATGVDSDRVLLFGGGASVGWGVSSYDLALPGALARALTTLTHRGTDVDVVADPESSVLTAIDSLSAIDLSRYDAVVLTLGLNESVQFTSVRVWNRELEGVLRYLGSRLPAHARIFLLGVHSLTAISRYDALVAPIVANHRAAINRATSRLSAHDHRCTFVPFDQVRSGKSARYRTNSDYRDGAQMLATWIAPSLDTAFESSGADRTRPSAVDEAARQDAVDSLHILDTPAEERFDRIVAFAQKAFHTPYAALTIIDHDRQWQKSAVGADRREIDREFSICATTILQSGALIVEDTMSDGRFPAPPQLDYEEPVRFYAGFPIEAPEGQRIGALCVLDTEVREASSVDRALLRDLALMVQREVWRGAVA